MDDSETLCVEFSPETTRWLTETAEACNTTREDVIRLLVIAPVFIESEETGTLSDTAMTDGVSSSGQTQALIHEALNKIYEVSARQRLDSTTIRNEVRSMFEMMSDS